MAAIAAVLTNQLPEGCEVGLPPVRAAWGAWFVVGGGSVEALPEQQGWSGDAAHLMRWLDAGASDAAMARLAFRLRAGGLVPPATIVLHDDGEGVVVATVSTPLVRVCAWLHEDVSAAA